MDTPAIPADAAADSIPARCENCDVALQGEYCHACGQSMRNPIRSFTHALEEVFEAFWHLDGRVFRTLRDLPVPARVACHYLAGHRARYIAPLRLFVILSLLTFFVGRMTVDFDNTAFRFDGDEPAIARARTVDEVERHRDAALAEHARGRVKTIGAPRLARSLSIAEAEIREQAAARTVELASDDPPADTVRTLRVAGSTPPLGSVDPAAAAPAPATGARANDTPGLTLFNDKPWNAQTNPLTVPWLPASINRWLNHKIGRAVANAPRLKHDAGLRKRVLLGSVPTALFVLMPVFALLLKLAYLGKRRLYLEHLVVALYSHAFLLVALLVVFVLVGLEHWLVPRAAWSAPLLGRLQILLWWAMPLYLLVMQKRVYGQGWIVTIVKYCVLGSAYVGLVTFAALVAAFAGLAGS